MYWHKKYELLTLSRLYYFLAVYRGQNQSCNSGLISA